jgi:hypothetical protein
MKHTFTPVIEGVLERHFGAASGELFEHSQLLQYINIKTRSAMRGSKSRSSFANLYALYVLIEDYIGRGFPDAGDYQQYEGPYSRTFSTASANSPLVPNCRNNTFSILLHPILFTCS